MSYTAESGRRQILDDVAAGIDDLGEALSALSDAYELLDEQTADAMEGQLFAPLQAAYGQLKRTHVEFAARHGLPGREFPPAALAHPVGPRATIDRATGAVARVDERLATLQDSMLPVEVGDQELRAGLARVRSLLDPFEGRASQLIRTLGR
ncbi:MAG TPA: hypothetical protein VL977_07890 [Solirubrobacteraceae bacterium]|nr:hypothetical protein [Solirubrobacteraceae bacterium]